MTDAEMTPGEIQRWLERIDKNIDTLREEVQTRHHKLAGEVSAVVVPVSTLGIRMGTAEGEIAKVQLEVQAVRGALVSVRLQAAALSGAIAFAGFLLGLWFKH
jgi:hypothetical protein